MFTDERCQLSGALFPRSGIVDNGGSSCWKCDLTRFSIERFVPVNSEATLAPLSAVDFIRATSQSTGSKRNRICCSAQALSAPTRDLIHRITKREKGWRPSNRWPSERSDFWDSLIWRFTLVRHGSYGAAITMDPCPLAHDCTLSHDVTHLC